MVFRLDNFSFFTILAAAVWYKGYFNRGMKKRVLVCGALIGFQVGGTFRFDNLSFFTLTVEAFWYKGYFNKGMKIRVLVCGALIGFQVGGTSIRA